MAVCDTGSALVAAARLFAEDRNHDGGSERDEAATADGLTETVDAGMLTVFTDTLEIPADDPREPAGLATAHAVPASLAMGRFWQLRDLFVRPSARRRGVAQALVGAVREAASAAGATRLSLMTELDNQPALDLYRTLGFEPVEGLVTLSLDLRTD